MMRVDERGTTNIDEDSGSEGIHHAMNVRSMTSKEG